MEAAGIIAIALAGFGFAGLALAFGVRKGQLEGDRKILRRELLDSEKERAETRKELDAERKRSGNQLEHLREKLNDNEDLLAMCNDPAIVHDIFDLVLQEVAAGGVGDSGPD